MEKEHVKGAAEKVEGKFREAMGHVTGNKQLENEGRVDEAKAAVHKAVGDAQEAGKDAIDSVKNAPSRQ